MWGSKKRATRIDTLVGRQTRVHGDVEFAGGLHVVGVVEGNVSATQNDAVLSVADDGRIQGEVDVPQVHLDGTVEGDVYASERIVLGPHAKVTGNVYYNLIEMAVGATINGKMVHKPAQEPRLLEHDGNGRDKEPESAAGAAAKRSDDDQAD